MNGRPQHQEREGCTARLKEAKEKSEVEARKGARLYGSYEVLKSPENSCHLPRGNDCQPILKGQMTNL